MEERALTPGAGGGGPFPRAARCLLPPSVPEVASPVPSNDARLL